MQIFYTISIILLLLVKGYAQTTSEQEAVRSTIDRLFEGMRGGDSSRLQTVFHLDAHMATTYYGDSGEPQTRIGSVKQFIQRAGVPHDPIWDEKISEVEIKVEDNLATAWMKYTFYLGDQRSHCGVNAMNLVKTMDGWQILYLVDTRKMDDCDVYENDK